MGEDHGGGVVRQGDLDHLARINARLGQGAAEQLVAGNHAMLCIEEYAHEHFVPAVMQQ